MELRYFVPFKAENIDLQSALANKLLNIEGIAVDSSVNLNKWQIPDEDLDFVSQSLPGVQLRIDHAESARDVIGKVPEGKRVGNAVTFRAEVGDPEIIEKILRGYLSHVSIQVDSDSVECSKCKRPTRKEGVLIHLCPQAYEIVHKPKVRELSIVASPAYQNTTFSPLGFSAAMNEGQINAAMLRCANCEECTPKMRAQHMVALADGELSLCHKVSGLSRDNENVGSRRESQEPENKSLDGKSEVKPLSQSDKNEQGASSHSAQIVNLGEGEKPGTQVDYGPYMKQLQDLKQQIYQAESAASDAEIETLKKQVASLESELAKKATKKTLSKKIADLARKMSEQSEEGEAQGEEGEEGGSSPSGPIDVVSGSKAEEARDASHRASGKGIVGVDNVDRDLLKLPNYDWFTKDILGAASHLPGFMGQRQAPRRPMPTENQNSKTGDKT